jgi:hypothetical protein
MKLLLSITLATVYGVSLRLLFSSFGDALQVMSISFFFLLPWLVGYLTILLIPYREGQTSKGAFFKTWLSCLAVFIVTYYLNIEGMVCWFMAFPVFLLVAGFGGVTAFHRKKRRAERNVKWDFEKKDQDRLSVSLLLFLPLFTGLLEGKRSSGYEHLAIRRQVELPAPPEQVWTALMAPTRTAAKPQNRTICSIMGFPNHLSTTVSSPEIGGQRTASYEKGLVFFETITRLEPNKRLELDIHTDPSTISKAIMDDHIVIGGEHIRMEGDSYSLEPLPGSRTRLTLESRFAINTPFNWYTRLWANWLMSDVLRQELDALR